MHDYKKVLAKAVKDARTKQGLSQERLAEILNLDSRTILNIEAGRGNPKFEILQLNFLDCILDSRAESFSILCLF